VVTAVYILRATGRAIMGPISAEHALLSDATWNEKLAEVLLIIGILIIGLAPFLINHLIMPSTDDIMLQMGKVNILK
jgi:NADH-quinone oxidoreductase subunit M